jgi:uncharacterized protein YbjT (DUF2867 family)
VNERGSITVFVVVFTVALLMVAGLVIDGGYTLAAHRRAFNEAEAAARAGAQAIDLDALRATGTAVLDPDAARTRAEAYLAATGHHGTIEVDGDTVRVHVEFHQPMLILSIVGVGPLDINGDGSARAVRGVLNGDDT